MTLESLLSSEIDTIKIVKARFWRWLGPFFVSKSFESCKLFSHRSAAGAETVAVLRELIACLEDVRVPIPSSEIDTLEKVKAFT